MEISDIKNSIVKAVYDGKPIDWSSIASVDPTTKIVNNVDDYTYVIYNPKKPLVGRVLQKPYTPSQADLTPIQQTALDLALLAQNLLKDLSNAYAIIDTLVHNGYLNDDKPYWDTANNKLFIEPFIVKSMFPNMARPKIISAANIIAHSVLKDGYVVIATNRHGGIFTNDILRAMRDIDEQQVLLNHTDPSTIKFQYRDAQGFIDQFGNYYTRTQAMALIRFNGQPYIHDRNGHATEELTSEGIY